MTVEEHIEEYVAWGNIHATCWWCLEVTVQPNKGLGRANVAAWRTRHQHRDQDEG